MVQFSSKTATPAERTSASQDWLSPLEVGGATATTKPKHSLDSSASLRDVRLRPVHAASRRGRSAWALLAVWVSVHALPIGAQTLTSQPQPPTHDPQVHWSWAWDANVILGFNYQRRKFRDFDAWESQNWVMGTAQRALGGGMLDLSSMLSLEALTLSGTRIPQVFQTGETFNGAPLVDYQHPHDFIMGLNGTYQKPDSARL